MHRNVAACFQRRGMPGLHGGQSIGGGGSSQKRPRCSAIVFFGAKVDNASVPLGVSTMAY